MIFHSQAEFITMLLLIPIFSVGLFIIISFIEIVNKYGEILFITKPHKYNKSDFLIPLIVALFAGLFIYTIYFPNWKGI